MSQARNAPVLENLLRPLTARSVVASTLLGMDPPRLSAAALVASGEQFGVAAGTTRVALSRMVDAGELTTTSDGSYTLAGALLERHARQAQGRHPRTRRWNGDWRVAIVSGGPRSAADRAKLRRSMAVQRMAELREGVWLRPDNLDVEMDPACTWLVARLDEAPDVETLFGPRAWAATARALHGELARTVGRLRDLDATALGETFVIAAATTRHLTVDPLLPEELLGPDWPGTPLRDAYDDYQENFRATLRHWYRSRVD